MAKLTKNQKGQSVVEVLISLAMASVIIVAIGSSLSSIHKLNTASADKEKSLAYAKQAMEIITHIENTTFGANFLADSQYINTQPPSPFLREIDKKCRYANGDFILCDPSLHQNAEKITVTIKWQGNPEVALSTIFTNWRNQ